METKTPETRLWGYILVETLICIAILSLGLVMVLNSFISEIHALKTSRNYTQAIFLSEEKFCEIEREVPIDIDKWNGKEGDFGDELERKNFRWEVRIKDLFDENGELKDMAMVIVRVIWKELAKEREVYLASYLKRETP